MARAPKTSAPRRLSLSVLLFAFALAVIHLIAGPAIAGGPITSAQSVNGNIATPATTESWTFTGTINQRVLIAAVTTGGTMNTNIVLRAPNATFPVNTSSDKVDYQLNMTGTWTIEITDLGQDQSGTYSLTFLNVTAGPLSDGADPDGGTILSNEIKNAGNQVITDFDAFTFTGAAGQRVAIAALTTGGAGHNTNITVYPPGGGAAETGTSADRVDHQLLASGVYTIVIEDSGNDQSGTYTLSFLNVTAGPFTDVADGNGGPIASNAIVTGTAQTIGDFDAWTFTGTAGQRVLVAAIATSGSFNSNIALYPPAGATPYVFSSSDRADVQLTATGTWTIVIEDLNNDHTGDYTLSYFNVTSGPHATGSDTDGAPIASNGVTDRGIQGIGDFDAFTFSGSAGQRVLVAALATGGPSFNTTITIYPPNGGNPETSTTADRVDHQLLTTGTYTIVIEDSGNDHTGTYTVTFLNLAVGPLWNASDPDGGAIASNEIKQRSLQTLGDFDAYRFIGTFGQRVLVGAIATGGTANTNIALYPPGGGAAVTFTSADRVDYQLSATGQWTIVIEDLNNDHTGTYTLTYFNVTAGPHTTDADPNGGPIVSNGFLAGSNETQCDFDAYTFSGSAGQRVVIASLATGGAAYNTSISLYPPGGGSYEASTSGDRVDHQLLATGTYTIVIEDNGLDHTGTYTLSLLNVTAGPFTSGTDSTGGPITSNQVRNGSLQNLGDFDAYTFSGAFGQRVLVGSVATSGSANTSIALYPPGGGAATIFTSADRVDYQLTATGTWTLVIEDLNDDNVGDYTLSYFNVTAGPFTNAQDTNGGAIASNSVYTGAAQTLCDFDAYTFTGTAGDRVLFAAIATAGATYNSAMTIYPPNGGPYETTTGGDRLDHQLLQTGTYTMIIEDSGLDHTGSFALSYVNLTAGPITSGPDPDGGTIVTGAARSGQISPLPDFDAYRFAGTINDTIRVDAIVTAGAMNSNIAIYPPGGAAAPVNTSADQVTYVLPASGLYSLVIEDLSNDQTGSYNLTFTKSGSVVGVPPGGPGGPGAALDAARVLLLPAAPTPFAARTSLAFSLPSARAVRLVVFDARGARVRTLVARGGELPAGLHRVAWDGTDDAGRAVAGGVYWARLEAGAGDVLTQKLVRLE